MNKYTYVPATATEDVLDVMEVLFEGMAPEGFREAAVETFGPGSEWAIHGGRADDAPCLFEMLARLYLGMTGRMVVAEEASDDPIPF